MKLKLKEDPREWQKFMLVVTFALAVAAVWMQLRGVIAPGAMIVILVALHASLVVALVRPLWFRGFYRAGMTGSFHAGQFIGKVLLVLIFITVVTPTGLLLRLGGKDLLNLRRKNRGSHWQPAKTNRHFDRQF